MREYSILSISNILKNYDCFYDKTHPELIIVRVDVDRALEQLDCREKEIVKLVCINNYKTEEVARLFNRSKRTIERIIEKSLQKMFNFLNKSVANVL